MCVKDEALARECNTRTKGSSCDLTAAARVRSKPVPEITSPTHGAGKIKLRARASRERNIIIGVSQKRERGIIFV